MYRIKFINLPRKYKLPLMAVVVAVTEFLGAKMGGTFADLSIIATLEDVEKIVAIVKILDRKIKVKWQVEDV